MEKKRLLDLSDSSLDKVVKIAGTKFDRRRKLSDKQINSIREKYDGGCSIFDLAHKYNVSEPTIRYHVDSHFRSYKNLTRNMYKNESRDNRTDRIAYKRRLVKAGANIILNE